MFPPKDKVSSFLLHFFRWESQILLLGSDSEDSTVCQNQLSSAPAATLADDPEEKKRSVLFKSFCLYSIKIHSKGEALWAEFQASVSNAKPSETSATAVKMVKIEKRYRFAGDEVVYVAAPSHCPW